MEIEQEKVEESDPFLLSSEKASDIAVFCSVAEANGAHLSLREVLQLTSLEATEEELNHAWTSNPELNSRYEIDSGVIYSKYLQLPKSNSLSEQRERRERAESNLQHARRFASRIGGRSSLVLSVSGSTSYLSVSKQDDLDFFCITRKDAMWIFLCKALIQARILRISDKNVPWLCLSYVMDSKYAEAEFTAPQDGLFARDAIATRVVHGEDYYNSLLKRCPWMGEYFPKMYISRTKDASESVMPDVDGTLLVTKITNYLLYLGAGTYIRMKSFLLNRKFAKKGEKSRLFRLRIGKDHCIYESENYLQLKEMYSKLEKNGKAQ